MIAVNVLTGKKIVLKAKVGISDNLKRMIMFGVTSSLILLISLF